MPAHNCPCFGVQRSSSLAMKSVKMQVYWCSKSTWWADCSVTAILISVVGSQVAQAVCSLSSMTSWCVVDATIDSVDPRVINIAWQTMDLLAVRLFTDCAWATFGIVQLNERTCYVHHATRSHRDSWAHVRLPRTKNFPKHFPLKNTSQYPWRGEEIRSDLAY